jgi:hypothetical protein
MLKAVSLFRHLAVARGGLTMPLSLLFLLLCALPVTNLPAESTLPASISTVDNPHEVRILRGQNGSALSFRKNRLAPVLTS